MNTAATSPAPPVKRRWLRRFSLRTLLLVMAVLGVGLGCVGSFWQRLKHQRSIVRQIEAAGGEVLYNYELGAGDDLEFDVDVEFAVISHEETPDGRRKRIRTTSSEEVVTIENPPGPRLIRTVLGDDAFAHVEVVSFFNLDFRSPKEFDPQLLLELRELKAVALVGPQVNDEWLHCLGQVPQLRSVNQFGESKGTATGQGLARLRDAKHLHSLGLSGDWVQDETLTGIAELRQLKYFALSSPSNVTSASFSNLQHLTELQELYVFRAKKIDDDGTEHLRRLEKLRVLTLRDTSISDASLVHLEGMADLESLDVGWTNVGDSGMKSLAQLTNLKRLNLDGTKVGDAGLEAISRLPRLRYLDVGTQLTDAGMPALARMTQLETLELYPSPISDSGLLHLRTLKNLKRLSVGPNVTVEGADVLRDALPDCKVSCFDKSGRGK